MRSENRFELGSAWPACVLGAALAVALLLAPIPSSAADPQTKRGAQTRQTQKSPLGAASARTKKQTTQSSTSSDEEEAADDSQAEAFGDARRRYLEEKERERVRKQGTERPGATQQQDIRQEWMNRQPGDANTAKRPLPGQGSAQGQGQSDAMTAREEAMKAARERWKNQTGASESSSIELLDPRDPKLPEQGGSGPNRSDWQELREITRKRPGTEGMGTPGASGTPSVAKGKKKAGECDPSDPLCAAVTSTNMDMFGNPCGQDGCPETPAAEFSCGGAVGNVYCRCTANCDANGYDGYTQYDEGALPKNAKKQWGGGKTEEQKKAEKAGSFLCTTFGIGCPAEPAKTEEAKKKEEEEKKKQEEEARRQEEERKKQEEAKKEEEEKKKKGSDPNCAIAASEDCYDYQNDPAWAWKQKQREEELRAHGPKNAGPGNVDPPREGSEVFAGGKAQWTHDTPSDPPDEQEARGPSLPDCSLAPGEGAIDPSEQGAGAPPGADFSHCEQDLPDFDQTDLTHIYGDDDEDEKDSTPRLVVPSTGRPKTGETESGRAR